jgi:hypothetical protein
MKTLVILTLIILAVLAVLRFILAYDPFMIKVFGVVMLLFGAIVLFAFGTQIEGVSGGAMEVSGAFIIAGAITILFI